MKHIVFLLIFLSVPVLVSSQSKKKKCDKNAILNKETSFPIESDSPDYLLSDYQVKIAFPLEKGRSRIWVKGGEENIYVQAYSTTGEKLSGIFKLEPPFYVNILSIDDRNKKVLVHFSNNKSELLSSKKTKTVYPKGVDYFNEKEENFSFLFYGCFQPFRVKKQKSEVLYKGKHLNYLIRKSFGLVSLGEKFKSKFYSPGMTASERNGVLINNPKVIIGTGDQIYTDAGYADKKLEGHPLSAWSHVCKDPQPLLDPNAYLKHLNQCYKHFNSFDCFDKSFSKLPTMSVWDDHEIRDGWGSHGDEYLNGEVSDFLDSYYYNSRRAYIEHNWNTGANSNDDPYLENNSLHQKTEINGVKIFAFDLRSNRNIEDKENPVISEAQMNDFKEWCASVSDTTKEIIIVSSIPIFYQSNEFSLWAAKKLIKELTDDIADSWSYDVNKKQRDEIISELIKLRDRNVKPVIVSGDVHLGGMISVWYKDKSEGVLANKRLCYEFIYSGLSHEQLGEKRSKFKSNILQHRAELPRVNDPTFTVSDSTLTTRESTIYSIYEFTRGRLNFGGIEFRKDKKTIASLFIIGDKENSFIENELVLNWEETYSEYGARCTGYKVWGEKGKFNPPEVPYNAVWFEEIMKKE